MNRRRTRPGALVLQLLVGLVVCAAPGQRSPADVVVLANRTPRQVAIQAIGDRQEPRLQHLASGGLLTIPTETKLLLVISSGDQEQTFEVEADSACYLRPTEGGGFTLHAMDLGQPVGAAGERPRVESPRERFAQPGVVKVKLLVDEDERAARAVWEARLRKRLEAASQIFERHFQIRFEVVAVETWQSDDKTAELLELLAELEREVSSEPAQLVIGFTAQPPANAGRQRLGVTRGPLHSWILAREWFPGLTEPERLEILVHELGHYLGAGHCPEAQSVMRPELADQRARARHFEINFDPLNALAIHLVGEDIRWRGTRTRTQFSPATRSRLASIYRVLSEALPDDELLAELQALVERRPSARLRAAAEHVADQIVKAASSQRMLRGEDATDHLVRSAALAAAAVPPDVAPAALLIGLGLVMPDSEKLVRIALESGLPDRQRLAERDTQAVSHLQPSVRGRRDLAEHFVASAALTAILGEPAAHAAGLAKELLDARRDSGFSFPDLAANAAGVHFANSVLAGRLPLMSLADEFHVPNFVPAVDGLVEGLGWSEFQRQFGGPSDPAFQRIRQQILVRIEALPAYQPAASANSGVDSSAR
ncbi:MAG: hypothetical protein J5I93_29340 [Pirellulaceae bacterium]|nr:hypothetical protein [Pirellulaceae bacterium]